MNTAPCKSSGDGKASPANSHPATTTSGSAAAGSAHDPAPCPPRKIVVRNGGTTDADVELTGGSAAAENSPQRANTNRLLGSTEEALKKIAGMQLNANQQETVKQVREYAGQSRAALEAGDLQLAHNLAIKAHLLADQILKPQP